MVSLEQFAQGLNTLERSLLDDFLRGNDAQKSSKTFAALLCSVLLPLWWTLNEVKTSKSLLSKAVLSLFLLLRWGSLQVVPSVLRISRSRTVNSDSPRWQGKSSAVTSNTFWATT